MTKTELRKAYKQKRASLTTTEIDLFNGRLLKHLLQSIDWGKVCYLHTFLPIAGQKEPDVWSFISHLKQDYPSVKIVISRSKPNDCSMEHFLWTANVELKKNVWGIAEPVDGERVDEILLDVVLVPLLVADTAGNRVGYGKGFYDRFLKKCRPDCLKIGVSFFDPIEKIDDVDAFDVPLDMLITPYSTHVFTDTRPLTLNH